MTESYDAEAYTPTLAETYRVQVAVKRTLRHPFPTGPTVPGFVLTERKRRPRYVYFTFNRIEAEDE